MAEDTREYSVSINFKTKGAEDTQKKIDKTKGALDRLKDGSKNIFKGIKLGAAAIVLKKVGERMFDLSSQTSDYIETVNLFRASMGSAADKAQEFVDKAERLLGLDPSNMMNSISSFYNLAEGFGIASDRAYTMSQNLTQLAGDLSSFANISFEQAQKKLMSGFSGQVMPLRQYGIALDQATLQEKAYSLGLNQKVKDMTRAQKSELIYYQIMSSTTKMQGDLGRSLLSPANSLRVIQTEFKRLARAVGSIFIPVIMRIIPVVRAVTQVLTSAAQAIARFFGFEMSDFNADLSSVGNLLSGTSDDIADIGDEADSTAKKLNKMLMPFDELNNVSFDKGSKSSGSSKSSGAGGGSLGIELPTYDMFSSISGTVDSKFEGFKTKLGTLFEPIQKSWNTSGSRVMSAFNHASSENLRLWSNIGKSVEEVWTNGTGEQTLNHLFGILSNILDTLGNIKGAFATAWETDGTGTQIIQNLADALNNVLGLIEDITGAFREFTSSPEFQGFAESVLNIIETVSGLIETISGKLREIWNGGFKDVFMGVIGFVTRIIEIVDIAFQALKPVIEWIINQVTPVIENVSKKIGGVIDTINGLLDILIGVFKGDWERVWTGAEKNIDGFKKQFGGAIKGVKNTIKTIKEFLKNWFVEPFKWGMEKTTNRFDTFKNTVREIIDKIKGFFSFNWELPRLKTPHISWGSKPASGWIANTLRALGLPTDLPKMEVSWYAGGGFPEAGELFWANEAGPELVGRIGNKSAVANQDQIVDAVARGVYEAVVDANSQSNSVQSPYIVVNLGNENLYKGYGKYKNEQANMYGITV